ncbi:MAG: hypothetical protein U0350_26700 [Caldilineaceae bacterium]
MALLVYLAVTQRPISREMLAAFLWPDYGQTQASAYLRHSLWTLTHTLGKQLLDVSRYTVSLCPGARLWVDVNEFQRQLDSCRLHGHAETAVCAACGASFAAHRVSTPKPNAILKRRSPSLKNRRINWA